MTYAVHTKVNWVQGVSSHWEDFFYPSLVKKIRKSGSYFDDLFSFDIFSVNSISDASDFLALYDKEIASRGNYIFKQDEVRENLNIKILGGKTYLLARILKKDTGKFSGGILFHISDNKLVFYLRVFDKEIRSSFRALTTLDFWAEKKIYEYANSQNLEFISHGTDSYPNKGRSGLVLFKLKVGGKPRISSKEHDVLNLTDEEIAAYNTPTFIWIDPNEENFFKSAHLFFNETDLNESILSELVKVCAWAGFELTLHKT